MHAGDFAVKLGDAGLKLLPLLRKLDIPCQMSLQVGELSLHDRKDIERLDQRTVRQRQEEIDAAIGADLGVR